MSAQPTLPKALELQTAMISGGSQQRWKLSNRLASSHPALTEKKNQTEQRIMVRCSHLDIDTSRACCSSNLDASGRCMLLQRLFSSHAAPNSEHVLSLMHNNSIAKSVRHDRC
jgi:hypothetical protein